MVLSGLLFSKAPRPGFSIHQLCICMENRDNNQFLGVPAYCKPENKEIPLGFVEGMNNKIRVLQRRAYGIKDEEYLRLKVLTCCLPEI